jgi:hypothetical protein
MTLTSSFSGFSRINEMATTTTTRRSVLLHISKVSLTNKKVSSREDESSTSSAIDDNGDHDRGAATFSSVSVPPVSKFRQLKDIMWIRETLEDLTGAEFALSVESESQVVTLNGSGGRTGAAMSSSSSPPRKKKRAVDYEKLMSQLTKRVEDMTRVPFVEGQGGLAEDAATMVAALKEDQGMGRYAYTQEQRAALLE